MILSEPSAERRLPNRGEIVQVRQRLYLVEDVVPPPAPGHASVVQGSCIEDDAQGQPIQVLWEHELDAEVRTAEAWGRLASRGFDPAKFFAGYLNTLRWNCVTSTDARLLQSPFRAGIKLDPYQLEPLRKALRLPRVNLFIADDVGLGKTIEAGLIARELLLRKKAKYIVVSCPPSMLLQWQEELANRFGMQFEILDADYIRNVRRERGFSVNPWTTHSRFLFSHRLLIEESYVSGLRAYLGDFCPGALLILDEAHHAAPASGQKYAHDSQITKAVRDLAGRFEHRLFLSATPHNGHPNSFSALLEILDPQRFCRGVPVRKENREDVMVRRIKEDLREIQGGFPKRLVPPMILDAPTEAPELRLFSLLSEYTEARQARLAGPENAKGRYASALALCNLQKRLFSSIDAFAKTLRKHRATITRQRSAGPVSTAMKLDEQLLFSGVDRDDDRATLSQEDLEAEVDAQIEAATAAAPAPAAQSAEEDLLKQMAELADRHRHEPDARVHTLFEWINANMRPNGEWNDTRIIIFTEFEDTLRYLKSQLVGEFEAPERILTFSGEISGNRTLREEVKKAFNTEPDKHPVRILLATDAAREGLNLQAYCHHLFHFDVPWNPSRMEQRNGRIDRKLQPAAEVFCHYFMYANRPEDRILECLVNKTKTIRKELGSLSQVIDSQVETLLKGGIRRSQIDELTKEIDAAGLEQEKRRAIEEDLEAARERQVALKESVDSLRTLMERSRREVGLDEAHFRSAISCALEMLGADALKTSGTHETKLVEWTLPKLDDRDPSWRETIDSLRAPRERDQTIAEWRRSSPIRPVVFEDPDKVTESVVQLHLEQRVVQRLLNRFLSQGFVHYDLSRACLAQTRDAIPRVILLGRLALYGPGAARLHEEIIPITARWTDPDIRKGPLQPYAKDAEKRTLDLLDQALLSQGEPNETIREQLRRSVERDITELLEHLETRADEYAAEAEQKLRARAEDEAAKMLEILEAQRKHIEKAEQKTNTAQLTLGDWSVEDRRQLEADRKHWLRRLEDLRKEIATEPARIRQVYQVQARRVEPVGIAYLWPETN